MPRAGARCESSFPSAQWHLCCTEGGTLPQVSGVDPLRVGLSWLYSVLFSSCLSAPGSCPWAGKGCGQRGPCRLSARVSNSSASRIRCAAPSGFCTGFPHPTQDEPWVQVHGSLTDNWLSPGSATHTLFWCHTAGQAMRVCIPRVYLGVSCGGGVALRDLGCFKCAAWAGASRTHCHPNRGPAPGLDSLWSQGQALSWVVALTDAPPCCGLSEQAQSVYLLWPGAPVKDVTGSSAVSGADLSPHCLQGELRKRRAGFPTPSCWCLLSRDRPGRARRLWRSRTEGPMHASGCSSPRVGVCLSSLFSLSCMILYAFFLQPWVYRSPSASLQTVFGEHCTTRRCVCGVFLGTGELQGGVRLLPHLSWSPPLSLW